MTSDSPSTLGLATCQTIGYVLGLAPGLMLVGMPYSGHGWPYSGSGWDTFGFALLSTVVGLGLLLALALVTVVVGAGVADVIAVQFSPALRAAIVVWLTSLICGAVWLLGYRNSGGSWILLFPAVIVISAGVISGALAVALAGHDRPVAAKRLSLTVPLTIFGTLSVPFYQVMDRVADLLSPSTIAG